MFGIYNAHKTLIELGITDSYIILMTWVMLERKDKCDKVYNARVLNTRDGAILPIILTLSDSLVGSLEEDQHESMKSGLFASWALDLPNYRFGLATVSDSVAEKLNIILKQRHGYAFPIDFTGLESIQIDSFVEYAKLYRESNAVVRYKGQKVEILWLAQLGSAKLTFKENYKIKLVGLKRQMKVIIRG